MEPSKEAIKVSPEVAEKFDYNLTGPNFDFKGSSYDIKSITLKQVNRLIDNGCKAFTPKKSSNNGQAKPQDEKK